MDTRELECFVAAYRHGSINQAAKDLFLSPQGLGKALKRLESDLGVVLFERTRNGLSPTPQADILFERSEVILKEMAELADAMQGRVSQQPEIKVAMTYGAQTLLGIDAITQFEAAHPEALLDIVELPDDGVDALLREGKATIGIIAGPVDPLFYDARFLVSVRHVAVVREDHPLAKKEAVSYADFDGQSVVLIGRQFSPFRNNMNRLARAGAVPERLVETGEIHKVAQFVASGVDIGISVEFEALDDPYPGVVVRPFVEEDCLWDLFIVHPTKHVPTKLEIAFADHLTSCVEFGKTAFEVS